jgi:hypothetical protein
MGAGERLVRFVAYAPGGDGGPGRPRTLPVAHRRAAHLFPVDGARSPGRSREIPHSKNEAY